MTTTPNKPMPQGLEEIERIAALLERVREYGGRLDLRIDRIAETNKHARRFGITLDEAKADLSDALRIFFVEKREGMPCGAGWCRRQDCSCYTCRERATFAILRSDIRALENKAKAERIASLTKNLPS